MERREKVAPGVSPEPFRALEAERRRREPVAESFAPMGLDLRATRVPGLTPGARLWRRFAARGPNSKNDMAIPALDTEIYGPHLNYEPSGGWHEQAPDRLVKTHCCFCGVQCGIQLKVRGNKIIGF